jgi:hypothetical protein|tara:strand:- start:249 stop:524 length:276 start_codon:yes stop_codon:yes gene_type:complete
MRLSPIEPLDGYLNRRDFNIERYKEILSELQHDIAQIAELYDVEKITAAQADKETRQILVHQYYLEDLLQLLEGKDDGTEKRDQDADEEKN